MLWLHGVRLFSKWFGIFILYMYYRKPRHNLKDLTLPEAHRQNLLLFRSISFSFVGRSPKQKQWKRFLFLNMFYSSFPHTSDSARVAFVGIIHSGLKHLHYLPDEEMRNVCVVQPLLWVGEAAGRVPQKAQNTKEPSSINTAGIRWGLCPGRRTCS